MKKILIVALSLTLVGFVVPSALQQADAQIQPPPDPSGCQTCGRIVYVMEDGRVFVIDPACVSAEFGSGGYIFCSASAFGCDLSSLCQVV